jgi:5-methylcytosine-specific restriction endonuclease McrA
VNAKANLGEHLRGGQVELVCDYCGAPFSRNSFEISKTKKHFCSRKCFGAWQSLNNTGERHPLFKGGYDLYYGPNWRQQRRNARHRDGYACRRCTKSEKENGKALDVHHIVPFREFGLERYKEANRLQNLVSLCISCHKYVEHHGWPC